MLALSTAFSGLERQEQGRQATDKMLVLMPMVVAQQRVSHGQESLWRQVTLMKGLQCDTGVKNSLSGLALLKLLA